MTTETISMDTANHQTTESEPSLQDDVAKNKFFKAKDGRGRDVDGLWRRNGRYYAQMNIPGKGPRRISLMDENNEPVTCLQAAKDALHELRKNRREGEMPAPRRAPLFTDYVKEYLKLVEKTKKPKTYSVEKSILNGWVEHLGSVRLTHITRREINTRVLARKSTSVGNRTVNMDVLVLRNLLKHAKEEGWFHGKLPTDGFKPLKYQAPKRPLFTKEQIEKICDEAIEKKPDGKPRYKNGEMLRDVLRLMRTSGARITSALATEWVDVDFERRQLNLRKTKYDKAITVDMNSELEAHLRDMKGRRVPDDGGHLFPGTRSEGNVGSLRKTFELVRDAAGLPGFHFHDCRHHFISYAVMSGIDLMQVARWVGHYDTTLISRVYGNLSAEHSRRAAKQISFEVSPEKLAQGNSPASGDLSKFSVEDLMKALQQRIQSGGTQAKAA